jgi:hypothetical protein
MSNSAQVHRDSRSILLVRFRIQYEQLHTKAEAPHPLISFHQPNMFCTKCQLFWQSCISTANIPATLITCKDIRWTRYETVLHCSVAQLSQASRLGCPICRAILSTPTIYERETLLADVDEHLDIILELDPDRGPHPAILATFREANQESVRLPKRMIAGCAGLLQDGKKK